MTTLWLVILEDKWMGRYFKTEQEVTKMLQETHKKVGARLKTLRKKTRTQSQLADEIKLRGGQSAVSKIERGKRGIDSGYLPIIADMYNTTVESFFSEGDNLVSGKNPLNAVVSSLDITDEERKKVLFKLNRMVERGLKNTGSIRALDIIVSVFRILEMGDYNSRFITEQLDVAYEYYDKTGQSMYMSMLLRDE